MRKLPKNDPSFNLEAFVEGIRCQYGRWWHNRKKDLWFIRECRKCLGCRMSRHDKLLAGLLAEAETSAQVLFVTGTYADLPDGSSPDAAKRLNDRHVSRFIEYWKRQGIVVRKLADGEYVPETGRAHWHMIIFIPLVGAARELFEKSMVDGLDATPMLRGLCVGHEIEFVDTTATGAKLKAECDDPDTIYIRGRGWCRKPCRQTHKSWPHGLVDYQLLYEAGDGHAEEIIRGITYVLKYVTKDPWKDSRRFQDTPFEELPAWVRQVTHFGPWVENERGELVKNRWVRWNPERDHAIQLNADLRDKLISLPIDMQPYVSKHLYKHRVPLGSFYFWCLGRYHAKRGHASRRHVISNYCEKSKRPLGFVQSMQSAGSWEKSAAKYIERVRLHGMYSQSRKTFYHSDSQHNVYGKGYNFQRELDGKDEVSGVFDENGGVAHSFVTLENRAFHAKRMKEGAFFFHILEKQSVRGQQNIAAGLLNMGEKACKGLISSHDWLRLKQLALASEDGKMLKEEMSSDWLKRHRVFEETWPVGRLKAVGLLAGQLFYVGNLDSDTSWFSEKIENTKQFDFALAGRMFPYVNGVATSDVREVLHPIELGAALSRLNAISDHVS